MALSRSSFVTRLTERVGNNTTFWEDLEKGYALNEGLSLFQALTGKWTGELSVPAASGVFQVVPRQIVSVQRVKHAGVELDQTSIWELDHFDPAWQDAAAGTPARWSPVGLTLVALNPPPSGGLLTFEGILASPRVFADGHVVDLTEDEVLPLVNYGQFYLAFKESAPESESVNPLLESFVSAGSELARHFVSTGLMEKHLGADRDSTSRPSRTRNPSLGVR